MTEIKRTDLETKPETTTNNLKDIISWLKLGDCVFIHNDYKGGRFFHPNCNGSFNFVEGDIPDVFNNCRVIYVNVKKMPGLLEDGEWNWYINSAGFPECHCDMRKVAEDTGAPPHTYAFLV